MRVTKYLHSCVLLEQDGKRLLIDPGAFSFVEKRTTPKGIGSVDAVLITHTHPDHYYPDALREFATMSANVALFVPPTLVEQAKQDGLSVTPLAPGERREIAGFVVEPFRAPHGPLPLPIPENIAYRVNGVFLHPGDSLEPDPTAREGIKVLALPIAGPPVRLVDATNFAKSVHPDVVIPIHDAIIKDFMLERLYVICGKVFEEAGIKFQPLPKPGDSVEI